MKENPEVAAKLESQLRQNAGLVAESLLVGPENNEAAEAEEGGDDSPEPVANDRPSAKSKKAS
jgi:hypothetical protein